MEQFLLKKPNNGMVIPTSGNKRNAPDPSSTPTTAARNSQSPSTSSSSNSGNLLCLSRPVSSSSPSSTGAMRPSILGARPSPASVSSGNSFASAMFMARSEEASSEFSPQQQQQQQRRAPSPTPPAQQRPFLQLGAPSPTPRFGAHTALSSTTSDNGNGLGGGNTLQRGLSGFGRFKSSFFGDSPSTASDPAEAQAAPSPAVEAASATTCDTANGEMRDLSANPGKAVSPLSMGGDGGGGVGGVPRESKTGDRASILGKKSRMGNNTASRPPDADNDIDNGDMTFEQDQDQDRDESRAPEATSFRRPVASTTPKPAEKYRKSPGALPGKQQGTSAAPSPQQPKHPSLTMLRRPSLARGGGGSTEGSGENRFDVGAGRGDNARNGNGGPAGGGGKKLEREENTRNGSGGRAGGEERLGPGNGEMGFRAAEEAEKQETGGAAPSVGRPLAAPERSSVVARSSSMVSGGGRHGPTAPEDACQRPDTSGRNDVMDLLDDEADAEETRAKTAQRQEWIRQKDAAMARFRRECEAEVGRVKSLMEEHVAELETLLDAELVDALDDTIGEKIEDNHREKTRARKVKSLVSAFFDDPRVPKAQRVMCAGSALDRIRSGEARLVLRLEGYFRALRELISGR